MAVLSWFGDQIWFLFDVDLGISSQEMKVSRGYAQRNLPTLRDVMRRDSGMLVAFVLVVGMIARALYVYIAPQNILDIRYVLAVLYSLYAIGIAVSTFQGVRDVETSSILNSKLWEIWRHIVPDMCSICRDDSLTQGDVVQLQCYSNEETEANPDRGLHSFHMTCIEELFASQIRTAQDVHAVQCPICRQKPLGFRRIYGPPKPNPLDFSTMMWYIHSLYARRMSMNPYAPLWGVVMRRPCPPIRPVPTAAVYLKILMEVQLLHGLLMTRLVLFVRLLYAVYLRYVETAGSVDSFTLCVALGVAIAEFVIAMIPFRVLAFAITQGVLQGLYLQFMNDLAAACSYLFPKYAPPKQGNVNQVPDARVRGALRRQIPYASFVVIAQILFYLLIHVSFALFCLFLVENLYGNSAEPVGVAW